jgi:hypothetical protein
MRMMTEPRDSIFRKTGLTNFLRLAEILAWIYKSLIVGGWRLAFKEGMFHRRRILGFVQKAEATGFRREIVLT